MPGFPKCDFISDTTSFLVKAISPMFKMGSKDYGNDECYYLKNKDEEDYISKETGFVLYSNFESSVLRANYKFNAVTDEDVKKPELSGYTKI